jgi:hypothetical protein
MCRESPRSGHAPCLCQNFAGGPYTESQKASWMGLAHRSLSDSSPKSLSCSTFSGQRRGHNTATSLSFRPRARGTPATSEALPPSSL